MTEMQHHFINNIVIWFISWDSNLNEIEVCIQICLRTIRFRKMKLCSIQFEMANRGKNFQVYKMQFLSVKLPTDAFSPDYRSLLAPLYLPFSYTHSIYKIWMVLLVPKLANGESNAPFFTTHIFYCLTLDYV